MFGDFAPLLPGSDPIRPAQGDEWVVEKIREQEMNAPNKITAANAGWALSFQADRPWPGIAELAR